MNLANRIATLKFGTVLLAGGSIIFYLVLVFISTLFSRYYEETIGWQFIEIMRTVLIVNAIWYIFTTLFKDESGDKRKKYIRRTLNLIFFFLVIYILVWLPMLWDMYFLKKY